MTAENTTIRKSNRRKHHHKQQPEAFNQGRLHQQSQNTKVNGYIDCSLGASNLAQGKMALDNFLYPDIFHSSL